MRYINSRFTYLLTFTYINIDRVYVVAAFCTTVAINGANMLSSRYSKLSTSSRMKI